MSDVMLPPEQQEILDRAAAKAARTLNLDAPSPAPDDVLAEARKILDEAQPDVQSAVPEVKEMLWDAGKTEEEIKQFFLDYNRAVEDENSPATSPAPPAQEPAERPNGHTRFKDLALPLTSKGLAVIPILPNSKRAFLPNFPELASSDPNQVLVWDEQYPHHNVGCVALAKLGGQWFFEVDSLDVIPRIEKDTGQKVSFEWFRVASRLGQGRGHFYFTQSDASLRMGNIKQDSIKFGDWSARVDNQYVVAPGSIHPDTGQPYVAANFDAPICPAPDWLVEWCIGQKIPKEPQDTSIRNANGLVPHGSIHGLMLAQAGRLRQAGLNQEEIENHLLRFVHEQCEPPIDDDKVREMAKSICKYPAGNPVQDIVLVDGMPAGMRVDVAQPQQSVARVDVSSWRTMFRSVSEMEDGPIDMVIEGVLQEGTCFIGANPGDGKTLVGLALAKAISSGEPLFGVSQYAVKKPRQVIYLIPESGDHAFRKRCEAFRIPDDKSKFMARTISAGVSLELGDPYLLEAVRETKPVVFLDTASRFMKGNDENASAQNRQLVNDVVTLLAAGAVAVVLLHHATKASKAKQERMTLENMLRGSSDLGAMCDQAYGIRKDMNLYANGAGPMEIEMVSLKDREQIGGLTSIRLAASYKKEGSMCPASYINEQGNFQVVSDAENLKRKDSLVISIVEQDPMMPEKEIAARTGMSEYAVRKVLNSQGWHRAKGGPDGASPWHQDLDGPCPYAKKRLRSVKHKQAEAAA